MKNPTDQAEWQNVFNNSQGPERRIFEIVSEVADRIDEGVDDHGEDAAKALSHALAVYTSECSLLDYSQVLVILANFWKNAESRLQLTFLEGVLLMEGLSVRQQALAHQAQMEEE